MEKIREGEQELRQEVHRARGEAGLNALLRLAELHRDKALASWRSAFGDDLVKYQSEYNTMQAVMDFINKPPREFKKP